MRNILFLMLIAAFLFTFTSCSKSIKNMLAPGVSKELAEYRKEQISQVAYELFFDIPSSGDSLVEGRALIQFHQARAMYGVILDFQGGEDHLHSLTVNGQVSEYQYINGHIVISSSHIIPGSNQLEIVFTATDQALNRSDDFMYTLFVPDRASTAFPCFDQPDLKARYSLTITVPENWTAVSNGLLIDEQIEAERNTLSFSFEKPLSTYLFAFAAGVFDARTISGDGRDITIYHRETDDEKINHNLERIARQHFEALAWLEDYTGIGYPFPKFDVVLIPGFQYSGMEHPGAIWYRDNRLLLDKQSPITQQLAAANLIAHETAHMWFGNLVTMRWFDDVWLKEVFAGFMADKIVGPQFPDINHELQFMLTHYPRANAVDRTRGTHPIKQKLDNMSQAGTLYGAIIYNKAPIVFQNLERLMGEVPFQNAVREYLQAYYYGNADWDELAAIFDKHSQMDLLDWSRQWIYGTGMPEILTEGMAAEAARAATYLQKHEAFLEGSLASDEYCQVLMHNIEQEENPQIIRYLFNNLRMVYWRFLNHQDRLSFAVTVESLAWAMLEKADEDEKPVLFEAYLDLSITPEGTEKMQALYKDASLVDGFSLTEDQRFDLVAAMKLRNHPEADIFLGELMESTTNMDRKRRLAFVAPALSSDKDTLDAFFNDLKIASNRRPEPWVLDAMHYIHHPLRKRYGKKYVAESLAMLEEIQRTGDIFFPLNWLEATLGGYGDRETANMVESYLETNPDLGLNLTNKVLQASDLLFRAANQ